jgi:hypothetical protein
VIVFVALWVEEQIIIFMDIEVIYTLFYKNGYQLIKRLNDGCSILY